MMNHFGATTSINRLQDALVQSKVLYRCGGFDMKSRKSLSGEKKYDLANTAFYLAVNTDNRIIYGPALKNMVYIYARSLDYAVSIGRIGKLECDFILRDNELNYAYVQVAYTIHESMQTEEREYVPWKRSGTIIPNRLQQLIIFCEKETE